MVTPRRGTPPVPPGISRAEVLALLEGVRGNVNDSSSRAMQMNNDAMTRIGELTKSLEFTQGQVDDFKKMLDTSVHENNKLRLDNVNMHREMVEIKEEMERIKRQVDYLDDYSRRNNLRISGLPESPRETWQQCQVKVTNFFQTHFNMTPDFERVHRVGRTTRPNGKPRDIVARFCRYKERDNVYQERRKLANTGTHVFINEDLCPNTLAVRWAQRDALQDARSRGKTAFFRYRTLVVRDGDTSVRPRTKNTFGTQGHPRTPVSVPSSPPIFT